MFAQVRRGAQAVHSERVGGSLHPRRAGGAPIRLHLDPAGQNRPGRSGPLGATTLAAPLHLGSVHLEKLWFLETASGFFVTGEGLRGWWGGEAAKLETPRRPGSRNKVELEEQPPR